MSGLSFQPAFDVFHTMFRYLRIREVLDDAQSVHRDQLRIADFYLSFFFRAEHIRLRPKDQAIKKTARRIGPSSLYQKQPDDGLLFARMAPIQHASLRSLVHYGYLEPDQAGLSYIVKTSLGAPEELQNRILKTNSSEIEIMESIAKLINEYPLFGRDGLKSRTGLMEHRYDVV